MLRGLPCKSVGLATSFGAFSTAPSVALLLAAPGPAQQPARKLLRSRRLHVLKDAMQKLKRCNEMMQGTQNAIRQLNERNNLATIY